MSYDIHLMTIKEENFKTTLFDMSSNFTDLLLYFPGANELIELFNSLLVMWWSGTCWYNLMVLDLKISCRDLM